ncbi:MAG: phosphodiester glycosidase family protein [Gammaproteobacteria bacterium]
MFRWLFFTTFFVLSIQALALAQTPTQWQILARGLSYAKIPPNQEHQQAQIHAFKIDLQEYQLDLAFPEDHASNVEDIAKEQGALLAINGGFFTNDANEKAPIGLRIQNGEIKSRLQNTSWWGIFYLNKQQAKIIPISQYKNTQNIETAIQAGPRLIIDGQIPSLKSGIAERSALCIPQNDKQLILLVTGHAPMSTTEFAKLIQPPESQGGLGCVNALNLDGGGSRQLYASIGNFKLNISGYSPITDALIVMPN